LFFAAAVGAALLTFSAVVLFVLNRDEAAERDSRAASPDGDDPAENLQKVLLAMALSAPVAVAAAAGLGYLLARQALAPLREASARARAARRSELDLVLPMGGGKEWDELAGTLNTLIADGRASLERIRRFTADAAHELRTPLTALIGEADLAIRRERTAVELRAILGTIREEGGRLAALLDALLMLARADSGTLLSRRASVDLAEIAREASKRTIDHARQGGRETAEIIIDAAPSAGEGDAHLLARAMENLLDNALRHGGGRASIRVTPDGACVRVVVSDDGPGIPPSLVQTLFQRFARGDVSRSSDGFGLGLAIARAIASAHGGTLELLKSDRGASFEMRLPLPPFAPQYAETAR
jgi:two-component system heavy metal sensor histidine kinase CusS